MQECAAQPEINLKTEDLLNALCVLDGSIRSTGCHPSTMRASAKNFKLCPHCLNSLVRVCVSVSTCACMCALLSAREQGIRFPGYNKVNGAPLSVAQGEQH